MGRISDPLLFFWPPSPPDLAYNNHFKATLVRTKAELDQVYELHSSKRIMAVDTETTGLSYFKDNIVGLSFGFDAYTGYYIPFRHLVGDNAEEGLLNYFFEKFMLHFINIFYNATFDLFMFMGEGLKVDGLKCFDVRTLVFNADSNVGVQMSLKDAARHYLGRSPQSFEDTVGGKVRFNAISPDEGLNYAVADVANTYGLYLKLMPILQKECPEILKIDNNFVKSMLYFMRQPLYIDKEKMKALYEDLSLEKERLEKEIFREFGYHFNLDCIPGDALINTVLIDGQLVDNYSVRDLFSAFLMSDNVKVLGPSGFEDLELIWEVGKKKVVNIYLEGRDFPFRCSENHVFLVSSSNQYLFKKAKDLTENDDIFDLDSSEGVDLPALFKALRDYEMQKV
jgi:hypothetical protein